MDTGVLEISQHILTKKGIKKEYFIASFNKSKVNYITIPKTGSTSILFMLLRIEGKSVRRHPGQYTTLHSVTKVNYITLEKAENNNYINFTLVRNPINRVYSAYYDFMYIRNDLGGGGGSIEFKKDFEKYNIKYNTFENFLKLMSNYSNKERGTHHKTQTSFCIIDNLITLKLENIKNTISIIDPRFILGKPLNANNPNLFATEKEIQLVHDIYAEDFELWENAK